VAEEVGIPVVVMGDVIRAAECRRRGLDPAEHHGRMAGTLREEEGDDAIATRTLPLIREAAADGERDTVLVDGLRSTVELERFREAFGDDFTLVAVRALRDPRRAARRPRPRRVRLRSGGPPRARRPRDRTRPRRNARTGRCRDRQHRDAGGVPGTRPGGARRRGRRGERRRGSRRRSRDPERRR